MRQYRRQEGVWVHPSGQFARVMHDEGETVWVYLLPEAEAVCVAKGSLTPAIFDAACDDLRFSEMIEKEMEFERDPRLLLASKTLEAITYFREAYEDTDIDTVAWAPEFTIVVRMLLAGEWPRKLVFLTDFEGERK